MEKSEGLSLFEKSKSESSGVPKVTKEISEEENEGAKRREIARSNEEWLSEFASQGTVDKILRKFLEEWGRIEKMKEKVGLDRADSKIIDVMRSAAFNIEEAFQDRDLRALHSSLEDFKDILEQSFGVDLERHNLIRIKSKRK